MPLVPINIYLLELFFKVLNFIKRKLSYLRRDHKDETEVMMILEPDNFKKFNFKLPDGLILRRFHEKDFIKFHLLMLRVDMGFCPLIFWRNYILPGGFIVVEHIKTKKIVGASFAAIDPKFKSQNIGTLEWLASHPEYGGIGIGPIIASKLSERMISECFGKIKLTTQAHRKKVITMYEKMGWEVERDYGNS